MCGIAGSWQHDGSPCPAAIVDGMAACMAHRGPDDEGVWTEGRVGFAHRRLSIIDLSSAGRQPMVSADGALVYNGEIYNYRELRNELAAHGASFDSTTDSEVLLAALDRWGPERTIPLLNGMFAFAYFDRRERVLWLVRDRLGIKQLYAADTGRELIFASEIKGLFAHPNMRKRVDEASVLRSFAAPRRGSDTLFDGVVGIMAGTWWRISASGIEKRAYFDLEEAINVERLAEAGRANSIDRFLASLKQHLTHSVRLHMVSDAPLAAMCSGGVDSSLIAALAKDDRPDLIGYVADAPVGRGEAGRALAVGRHLGLKLEVVPVDRELFLRLWPETVAKLDAPTHSPSDAALLAVTRRCRADGIKVLLTGEGADELFGGYPWYGLVYKRWRWRQWRMRYLPHTARPGRVARWSAFPHKGTRGAEGMHNQYRLALIAGLDREQLPQRMFAKLADAGTPADIAFLTCGLGDLGTHLSWILARHDHMGMASSIEMRVPFIENTLIDFALHLPRIAKYQRRHGKWIEKQWALERLPRKIVLAPKRGFPMPSSYSLGSQRLIANGRLAEHFGWSSSIVATLLDDLKRDEWLRFRLVSTEIWLRQQFGGESVDEIGEKLVAMAGP